MTILQPREDQITRNTQDIQRNTQGIQRNTQDIQRNTQDIQRNTLGIQENTQGIQRNTKNLVTYGNSIDSNTTRIDSNGKSILGLIDQIKESNEQIEELRDLIQKTTTVDYSDIEQKIRSEIMSEVDEKLTSLSIPEDIKGTLDGLRKRTDLIESGKGKKYLELNTRLSDLESKLELYRKLQLSDEGGMKNKYNKYKMKYYKLKELANNIKN